MIIQILIMKLRTVLNLMEATFVHGSPNANLRKEDILIIRPAHLQKHGKRPKPGRTPSVFGGFYVSGISDVSHAREYAKMMEGTPTIYHVVISDDAKIVEYQNDITRIPEQEIQQFLQNGVDVLKGKDYRGRMEYAIINKEVIENMTPQQPT